MENEKLSKCRKFENERRGKVHVKGVIKLGEKACLIQLGNEKDKNTVMQRKSRLRGKAEGKWYIQDDLSKIDWDIQRQIRVRASQGRKNGNTVKMGHRKLYVGNEKWRWNKDKGKLMQQPRMQNLKN